MKYYFFKLIPPRPSFPADMTPEEGQAMQDHVVYWKGLMKQGTALAFGPVADPKGVYGIGLVRLDEHLPPEPLGAADPAVVRLGFRTEIQPMPSLVLPEQFG